MMKNHETVTRMKHAHDQHAFLSLPKIAAPMGISAERVRQLEAAYIKLIRRLDYVAQQLTEHEQETSELLYCEVLDLTPDALKVVLDDLDLIHTYERLERDPAVDRRLAWFRKRERIRNRQ
jgi:hypothetical protein